MLWKALKVRWTELNHEAPPPDNEMEGPWPLTDVPRMNVRHFLHSLDEPKPCVQVLDHEARQPRQILAHRTYHLNVVLRFWRDSHVDWATLRKIRVVIDQGGICRIDAFEPGRGTP